MHIPDGFLSTPVWATLDVAALPAIGVLARRAGLHVEDSRIPLLGVLGAFVFAAQMINFPVGFGTSGHLIGGTLLACTIGPAAASIVMTGILTLQALLFQDGGVLALGANIMSMAVIGVLAGYLPYHFWGATRYRRSAIFAGAALSVAASACTALLLLYLSGVTMPTALLGVPAIVFAVNAIAEAVITVAVIQGLERINPLWVRTPTPSAVPLKVLAVASIFLACCGFVFASAKPDGLESLGEHLGIASHAATLIRTPLAEYQAAFVNDAWLSRAAAGLLGVASAYALSIAAMRLLTRLRRS